MINVGAGGAMTTHTWQYGYNDYIYDPRNYVDGSAFTSGDTLIVNGFGGGSVFNPASFTSDAMTALVPGTYLFYNTGSIADSFTVAQTVVLPGATLVERGVNGLNFFTEGQFINDGTLQFGTASVPAGKVNLYASDFQDSNALDTPIPASITNNGTLSVQNGTQCFLLMVSSTYTHSFVNTAGGLISVSSGGSLSEGADDFTNDGLITINGSAGISTGIVFQKYQGTGVLSLRGAPGSSAKNTFAMFDYNVSGVLDLASAGASFTNTHVMSAAPSNATVQGTINIFDDNVLIEDSAASEYGAEVQSTINGFQAGDVIQLDKVTKVDNLNYDPSTHLLTAYEAGSAIAQFHLAGNYQTSDFHVSEVPSSDPPTLTFEWQITTMSTANALSAFTYKDTTTGAVNAAGAGTAYTGPLSYLQSQFVWPNGSDNLSLKANAPDVFVKGGAGNDAIAASAGSNVLDGGAGSNFLLGATGADGGTDTFFLDGRNAAATWDTLVNFHASDSVTLWGFVPGKSTYVWTANDGTAGFTGATLHVAFDGQNVTGSVTFAGLSLSDAQAKLGLSSGTAGSLTYLYMHDNG